VEHEMLYNTGTGSTEIKSKGLKCVERIPGRYSIDSLKKIVRKVLQSETEACVVRFAIGSRGEVPGKRRPMIVKQQQ
jgi:hypothetical protein